MGNPLFLPVHGVTQCTEQPADKIRFGHTFTQCQPKQIVFLHGQHTHACAVGLAPTVEHFLAPILAAVTLVVVVQQSETGTR